MGRKFITAEQAIAMLPDGDDIHTYRQSIPNVLIGADWRRADIIEAIRAGKPELTGEMATSMNHGVAVDGLFIETKKGAAQEMRDRTHSEMSASQPPLI